MNPMDFRIQRFKKLFAFGVGQRGYIRRAEIINFYRCFTHFVLLECSWYFDCNAQRCKIFSPLQKINRKIFARGFSINFSVARFLKNCKELYRSNIGDLPE